MIQYRTFRNADPPGLLNIWNEACTGRGAAFLTTNLLLEFFLLAKPFFDPAGLIVATEEDVLVGFSLAGFAPTSAWNGLDYHRGVTCAVAVLPSHQHRGIGSELLARAETYLRGRGAIELYAGPQEPLNPFTFAIYGGADSPGFLESEIAAQSFLEKHSYRRHQARLVLQRSLEAPVLVTDGRFVVMRQRYEVHAGPRHTTTWWHEAVLGPVELHEYCLTDKGTGQIAARLAIWEMEPYRPRWNQHAIGIVALEVLPGLRRQGLGKYLLFQVLRHLQEQFFTLTEVQVPPDNTAALGLVTGLGFGTVDVGYSYRRE